MLLYYSISLADKVYPYSFKAHGVGMEQKCTYKMEMLPRVNCMCLAWLSCVIFSIPQKVLMDYLARSVDSTTKGSPLHIVSISFEHSRLKLLNTRIHTYDTIINIENINRLNLKSMYVPCLPLELQVGPWPHVQVTVVIPHSLFTANTMWKIIRIYQKGPLGKFTWSLCTVAFHALQRMAQ